MNRKKLNKHLTFTVLLLTTLVFIGGIFIGSLVSEKKVDYLISSYEKIRLQTIGLDVQNTILQEYACDAADRNFLTDELQEFSERLAFMENSFGWDNKKVLAAKEYFSLLEIRHWLLVKKSSKECNQSINSILYFYSNEGDCPDCQKQGAVLLNLKTRNPNLYIYHFDINIDNPAINTIKEIYGVTSTPGLIINEYLFNGFQNLDGLKNMLNN